MWPLMPNGIYCFNYHRIGDEEKSVFDPNVFSCTQEQFEQHIQFYNTEFTVISVEQLIEFYHQNKLIDKKYALITFDDGYIDNYEIAFPILKKHQTPAAFYIATNYLDNPHIPWWDEIAWIIRHSNTLEIQLSNWTESIDISKGTTIEKVRAVLKKIKQDKNRTMKEKITELEGVCSAKMPDDIKQSQLFVNWQQIKEMSDNGMHIGSHTMSHNILSHLDEAQQKQEIESSKSKLEQHLEKTITSIAYPVGGSTAFTEKTQQLAKQANYELAFSFIPGVITDLSSKMRYQLRRLPVDGNCTVQQLKNIMVRNR